MPSSSPNQRWTASTIFSVPRIVFFESRTDTLGNSRSKIVHENESVYIPIGAVHRLENPGKILLELIEVQTGSYLGEDDIMIK